MTDSDSIKFKIEDNIGIIIGNNAPVNALSHSVRQGLLDNLKKLNDDQSVTGIILMGEGRTFFAGADISEFGKPMQTPSLNDVINEFELSKKPIVAAMHGTPLGGGLELALGCNYRVALKSTNLGLPEVKLGIIPGAGGTQRLPRLAGIEKALSMITSGTPIPATEALNHGIVDAIYDEELLANSKKFLLDKIETLDSHPITSKINERITADSKSIFEDFTSKIKKKFRGRKSPLSAIEAVKATTELDFKTGLEKERELFKICHDSTESSSLIHMFFSERQALKIPDIPKDTLAKEINSVAVLGCGTMGGGIAMSFANVNIPVVILENDQESLDKGMELIKNNYYKTVSKGRLTREKADKRISNISGSTDYNVIKDADIVIEAVFEDMSLKKKVFKQIDGIAKPGCILASNTSTLDIDEIASATQRPNDVIGTHFFSPANVMKLLEVVRGSNTGKEIIAATMKLAKRIKKIPVLAGNCDGFIGNRMFHSYIRQAHALAEEGAKVSEIDKAAYEFGWAMGPFAVNDLAGNDVGWRIRKRQMTEGNYDNIRYTATVADKLCEKGRFGQKTSRGFYIYDPETRKRLDDPEVDEMFEKVAKEKGIVRRTINKEEIMARLNWALLNTGCLILEEGFALRASDIDVIYAYGYGYPAWRGGPMKFAQDYGLDKVLQEIKNFKKNDDGMWPISSYLEELANSGKKF